MINKRFWATALLAAYGLQFSGCAAVSALKQPEKKNLQVLNQGTSRDNVIAYLGAPISTEREAGGIVDIYQFVQGYTGANKATRATMHVVFDIFTLFLWEIVAWPAEAIFDGEKMTVKVTYDDQKQIRDVVYLTQPSH